MCIRKPHLVTRVFTNALSKIFGLKFEGNKFETTTALRAMEKRLFPIKDLKHLKQASVQSTAPLLKHQNTMKVKL
jgi:hypothetical protein